jgi:LacI family transcriptional regulator
MVRLADIAREAGVSIGLVSRILNDDPALRATKETRQRVQKVADTLGYQPHYAARALRLARTNTIALVLPVLTNPIFGPMLRGVEEEAGRLGYTLLLARSESLGERRELSSLVVEGRVDGFLLQGRDDETDVDLAARVGRAPVVLINSRLPERPGSVMIDDRLAAELATEHLLAHGHRRLAMVNGLPASETARRRQVGFTTAVERAGLDPARLPVTHEGYDPGSAHAAVTQLFQRRSERTRPTGLVVANVNASLAVLTELRARGLRTPEDVSVVAIQDAWTANHSWPPVSTIRLPVYEQGRQSLAMLHDALNGQAMSDVIVDVAPELVERASVGPAPAVPDGRRTHPVTAGK